MGKKTTIYDIAKELKITAATVSRALNNNSKISEGTRKLVADTALKMNYEQNKLAKSLQSGKSNSIGVIVPRINTNFLASVIRGIEEELQPEGYHVIICQTQESEEREIENINTLLNAQVDGILMSISNVTNDNTKLLERVVKKNIPLVFFDRKLDIEGVSSVTIDDFQGAYMATKHLIEQGCTKIAHLAGNQALDIYKNRFGGYKKALLDHSLEFVAEFVIPIRSNLQDGKDAVQKLLQLKSQPDAIFSSSDFAALGAIQELKENGIKIPQDFCVFGFGNEPFTQFMELTISSVDQSPIEMGKRAARVFLEQVNQKKGTTVMQQKVVLMPKLEFRKSSNRKHL